MAVKANMETQDKGSTVTARLGHVLFCALMVVPVFVNHYLHSQWAANCLPFSQVTFCKSQAAILSSSSLPREGILWPWHS
jgi:hypothetical protein